MRIASSIPLALALLVGCRISDTHFTGPGVFDDAPTGDVMGGGDGDASPGTGKRNGYLLDQGGLIHVRRDPATGALSNPVAYPGNFMPYKGAVLSKSGTFLYVFSGNTTIGRVTTYIINAQSGALTENGTMTYSGCVDPSSPVIHPSGNFIVLSCSGGMLGVIPVMADGRLGSLTTQPGGSQQGNAAFTPDGRCLYVTDPGAAAQALQVFATDASMTGVTRVTSVPGAATSRDVVAHPNSQFVYSVGNGQVMPWAVGAGCALAQKSPVTVMNQTSNLAIDPSGTYLFALSTNAYSFTITTAGATMGELMAITGSPTTPLPGASLLDMVFDPTLPNLAHVLQLGGVTNVPLMNGLLGNGTATTGAPATPAAAFVLAP